MNDAGEPALDDERLAGVTFELIRHRRASSLEEAAQLRGVEPDAMIKTMVVRRGEDDYIFALVPGDRVIDWPKLRSLLGERRLSMPDADEALAVTGYARGTITPFGSKAALPVIADVKISSGTVSVGAGRHGSSLTLDGADMVRALDAAVADITKPRSEPA